MARLQNACPSVGPTRRRVRDMNHIKGHAAPIHSIRGRPTDYGVCQCKIFDPAQSSPCSRSDSSPRLTTCHWGSSYERHKLDHATSHGPPPARSIGQRDVRSEAETSNGPEFTMARRKCRYKLMSRGSLKAACRCRSLHSGSVGRFSRASCCPLPPLSPSFRSFLPLLLISS